VNSTVMQENRRKTPRPNMFGIAIALV